MSDRTFYCAGDPRRLHEPRRRQRRTCIGDGLLRVVGVDKPAGVNRRALRLDSWVTFLGADLDGFVRYRVVDRRSAQAEGRACARYRNARLASVDSRRHAS